MAGMYVFDGTILEQIAVDLSRMGVDAEVLNHIRTSTLSKKAAAHNPQAYLLNMPEQQYEAQYRPVATAKAHSFMTFEQVKEAREALGIAEPEYPQEAEAAAEIPEGGIPKKKKKKKKVVEEVEEAPVRKKKKKKRKAK